MKTALIYPPYSAAIAPHLALPALTAYLRREGQEVVQADANLWMRRWLMTPAALEQKREQMIAACGGGRQDRGRQNLDAWIRIIPPLASRIGESLQRLRRRETWRIDPATGRGGHAPHAGLLRIVETLLLQDLPLDRWTTLSAPQMVETVRRGGHPLLARFQQECVSPWLRREAPDLVGITVPFRQQLLPALLLADVVRRERPQAKIVFGGHLMTQQLGDLQRMAGLFDLIDYAVIHDGEEALAALCRRLDQGRDPVDAGNLLWRDAGGTVQQSAHRAAAVADLPIPDFGGLDLEDYLSGEVIFPLETSRGCYWNRCTYCSFHRGEDGAWRPFPLERVAENLIHLGRQHGAAAVMAVDEAMPPPRARKLASMIRDQGLDLTWYFMGRLEKGFSADLCRDLADAGLYGIFFGLESGCETVLERMDKGIDLEVTREVLGHMADAGLAAHLSLIGGFPGETEAQATQTRDLVVELIRGRPGFTANAHTFHLNRNSVIYENPADFGIAGGRGEDGRTLAIHYETEQLPGSRGPDPAALSALINIGLRPHAHSQILTEEEGVNYFINHGRQEFLRGWARGTAPPEPDNSPGARWRSTGEVLLGTAVEEGPPQGSVTLCHLVRGALVGAPPVAGRLLSLFLDHPPGELVLDAAGAWEQLGRPEGLPPQAVHGLLVKLGEFGALETVS